jgi:iron complex outermembrane receptor protein
VVNAPKTLFKSQFGYDDGNLFAKLDLDYTGKRYFTYTNDLNVAGDGRGSVDAYTLLNLGAGYRLSRGLGFLKELAIQANVTNLTDQKYISTIGSNGFVNSGDDQTFLPGAPRQWFLSVSGQF